MLRPSRTAFYLGCVILGGLAVSLAFSQEISQAKATFVFISESVMRTPPPSPLPEPAPVSDICENCNGRGKVGDGTVFTICPVCDGTGKRPKSGKLPISLGWPPTDALDLGPEVVEAPPVKVNNAPAPASNATKKNGIIEVWHGPDCPACDALMLSIPSLRDQGWQIVDHPDADGLIPRTRIWVDGIGTNTTGFFGEDKYFDAVRGSLSQTSMPSVRISPVFPAGYRLDDDGRDYRPRWSWPGNLESHLRKAPHSIETSTWTQDQRERYHDQYHDRYGK